MRFLGGWALLTCVIACDSRGTAVASSPATQPLQAAPFGVPNALDRFAHEGVRLVEFFAPDGSRLAYREHVATDGQGRFTIGSTELVEGKGQDPELFALLQNASQGFLHRYRDFAIRNGERFDRNYDWQELDGARLVAGRDCRVIEVVGKRGERGSYVLALDEATGIVLASEERDRSGRLAHAVTYESFDAAPDLSRIEWHAPVNQERRLDLGQSLSEQIGAPVLEPRLLPAGYAWSEAATVDDGQRPWLKTTYTDGVRTVLFLQGLATLDKDGIEVSAAPASPATGPSASDRVTVYSMGAVTVVQGHVAGRDVIALGRVPEAELLDLIESALP